MYILLFISVIFVQCDAKQQLEFVGIGQHRFVYTTEFVVRIVLAMFDKVDFVSRQQSTLWQPVDFDNSISTHTTINADLPVMMCSPCCFVCSRYVKQ
jgi:hypothetical protein